MQTSTILTCKGQWLGQSWIDLSVFLTAHVQKNVIKIKAGVKRRNWELGLTDTKTAPATKLSLGSSQFLPHGFCTFERARRVGQKSYLHCSEYNFVSVCLPLKLLVWEGISGTYFKAKVRPVHESKFSFVNPAPIFFPEVACRVSSSKLLWVRQLSSYSRQVNYHQNSSGP